MSKKARFTQGPWKIYKNGIHPTLEGGSAHNNHHAICGEFYGPDAPFNQALVAVAPDIYEGAQELLETLATLTEYMFNTPPERLIVSEFKGIAANIIDSAQPLKSAMEKARGQ